MKKVSCLLTLVCLVALGVGCQKSEPTAPGATAPGATSTLDLVSLKLPHMV